jgi:hypothetical protein
MHVAAAVAADRHRRAPVVIGGDLSEPRLAAFEHLAFLLDLPVGNGSHRDLKFGCLATAIH